MLTGIVIGAYEQTKLLQAWHCAIADVVMQPTTHLRRNKGNKLLTSAPMTLFPPASRTPRGMILKGPSTSEYTSRSMRPWTSAAGMTAKRISSLHSTSERAKRRHQVGQDTHALGIATPTAGRHARYYGIADFRAVWQACTGTSPGPAAETTPATAAGTEPFPLCMACFSAAVVQVSTARKSRLKRRLRFKFSTKSEPRNPQLVACMRCGISVLILARQRHVKYVRCASGDMPVVASLATHCAV